MNRKPLLAILITVIASAVIVIGITAQGIGNTETATIQTQVGQQFTYQGRLENNDATVTGTCDFKFSLFDAASNGTQIGTTQTLTGKSVNDGYFNATLNFGDGAFDGEARWLAIQVRCPSGSGTYTTLTPRQALTAAPYALSLAPGAVISGTNEGWMLEVINSEASSGAGGFHAEVSSDDSSAIYGFNKATAEWSTGVTGGTRSANGAGVIGYNEATTGGWGVWAESQATSGWAVGVEASSQSPEGVGVHGVNNATTGWTRGVNGESYSPDGIGVAGLHHNGGIGVYASTITGTAIYAKSDSGGLIQAVSANDVDTEFYVSNDGNVYADGAFNPGGADFAEMLPAQAELEPGDVLIISKDGKLSCSTMAYQSAVAGVYSTQPGFLGGAHETELDGKIPLAIVGVVPVKVSDENGLIQPGDLLTTSSTPGYAMKADPIEINGVSFYPSGVIIGKALEALENETGVIQILVTLQ